MKAILEFDLPEETTDHSDAINGFKYKLIIANLDEHLRQELKYNDKLSAESQKAFASIREFLWSQIDQRGLIINK